MIFPTHAVAPLVTIHPNSAESIGHTWNQNLSSLGISATYPTANKAIFVPFLIAQTTTFTTMFCMNGAAVSGNVDLGIYTSDGTKLVSTGSTAQAGTSTSQAISITATQLAPGLYYMAIALDNTTGTLLRYTSGDVNNLKILGLAEKTTAFALPATVTMATVTSDYIPIFGLSTRAVI